jgi:hypothetical protein
VNSVHVTVFLVSLKAGGVALNLTEASTVFLMDSWWNPAVEYRKHPRPHLPWPLLTRITEAMDRIHRLGQHRPVKAIKIVIEDSIESSYHSTTREEDGNGRRHLVCRFPGHGAFDPRGCKFLLGRPVYELITRKI